MSEEAHVDTHAFYRNRKMKTVENKQQQNNGSRTALVLGGGAPNMALMAGALAAFAEKKITFDVVSTSGAGALAGLLWLAPKGGDPQTALRNITAMSISDPLYSVLPVNFKVFNKPGAFADLFRQMLAGMPFLQPDPKRYLDNPLYAFWADMQSLTLAAATPSGLSSKSWGLCAPEPFIEAVVDFDKVKSIKPEFYINAYNVNDQIIDNFTKDKITPDHFRAALAFPFIYGPYSMDGKLYYEGAVVDCLNFKDLVELHPNLKTVVVFDVLGSANLIRAPRSLYDSWVLSMIIPLVKTAEDNLELFLTKYKPKQMDVLKVPFPVPPEHMTEVLDWSASNASRLFDLGHRSGLDFVNKHRAAL